MDDDGRVTQVDIYRPGATPSGAVILAHGFLRSRANMAVSYTHLTLPTIYSV